MMLKNDVKIVLGNCFLKNGNNGCVALSLSAMYIIQKIFDRVGKKCTFVLPQSGYKTIRKGSMTIGDVCVSYECIRDLLRWSVTTPLLQLVKYREFSYSRKCYKKADYLLDVGQGDSFTDIYGDFRFKWVNNSYSLARRYRLKYCFLPQTIGPFHSSKNRDEGCLSLEKASLVFVRDSQSYQCVEEIAPKVKPIEITDIAFFLPYVKHSFDSSKVHVGLNVSGLLWNGGYTKNNQFGLTVDYQKLIYDILSVFLAKDNVVVHLVPHVISESTSIEDDYRVSVEIYEKFNTPNLVLSPHFCSPVQAKNYIAGLDFLMGARMHATIAAFSSGVPVFPMAYSRKFNGLFVETLDYKYMGDMKVQKNEEILKAIKAAFAERHIMKEIISNRLNGVVRERGEIFINHLEKFFDL